ncbi:SBBP repeat-containing protein, partial [bacterium]|nr:SBBP repeat-containing protein [bacterium]
MNKIAKAGALIALTLALLSGGPWRADANGLLWSTFLGGSSTESGQDIVLDNSGNIYVTGQTFSADFPFTSGAFDTIFAGGDAFVAKLNAAGTALSYATFLGGGGNEIAWDIAVDDSGKAHVIGLTWSTDFPVTATAFDTSHNGQADVFVVKLNATGSALEYATFLGGTSLDMGNGVDVDGSGYAYVTGTTWSPNFPITSGACDTTYSAGEVFVTKFNLTGSALEYSTFLGGTLCDEGYAIAVNDAGKAYVTGGAASSDFPTTTGAYDESHNGDIDVFVARLNTSGSDLDYATYLGGENSDYGYGIVLDGSDYAYLTGETYYSALFPYPTTSVAYDTTHNGDNDCFVSKLNPTGSDLSYSTLLGGNYSDVGYGIALDGSGHAYVTGETYSANFPTTTGAYDDTLSGDADGFLARLSAPGSVLDYSTFLGGDSTEIGYGIALDNTRHAYVTGETYSADFPVTSAALDTTYNGGDAFVAKLSVGDTTTPEAIDDLSITLESPPPLKGSNIRLRWSEPFSVLTVSRYVIYRSITTASLGDSLAGTTDTTYLDIGATGNVDTNYCYAVKAVDTASNLSDESNKVGEYDYALKTTTGSDYTWIVFCLGDTDLGMTSDLWDH